VLVTESISSPNKSSLKRPSKGAHFVMTKPIWLRTKHQQDKPAMELTRLCLSASVLMNIRKSHGLDRGCFHTNKKHACFPQFPS
ncbi:unnamed protein product, partial [Urochloa humidicola]